MLFHNIFNFNSFIFHVIPKLFLTHFKSIFSHISLFIYHKNANQKNLFIIFGVNVNLEGIFFHSHMTTLRGDNKIATERSWHTYIVECLIITYNSGTHYIISAFLYLFFRCNLARECKNEGVAM